MTGDERTSKGKAATHLADRLIEGVRMLGHPLCAGVDPHLPLMPLFRRGTMAPADPQTSGAVEAFLIAVLDRVAQKVNVVKPQSASFEKLGWRGIQVLGKVIESARARGLLVLLDAERGDIDSTAEAHAAYLDPNGVMLLPSSVAAMPFS
ncbi:MAG: orotidine 5'-phosphate decarboxylase / HUMPS family protein [Candidatus Binataceae bacterium]